MRPERRQVSQRPVKIARFPNDHEVGLGCEERAQATKNNRMTVRENNARCYIVGRAALGMEDTPLDGGRPQPRGGQLVMLRAPDNRGRDLPPHHPREFNRHRVANLPRRLRTRTREMPPVRESLDPRTLAHSEITVRAIIQ